MGMRLSLFILSSCLISILRRVEIPAVAVFEDLPVDPLYTLALDLPGSWLTRPKESVYDLDNIQLGKLSPGDDAVEALFELDYIVIEGHARDTLTNGPPRGVQLELTNADESSLDDTLVVANLGYFQFKAKPGVFELGIREGRSKEVFELQSVGNEGWESRAVEEIGREVTVTSFEGLTLYPRLQRRPGMEQVDVLSDEKLSSKDNGVVEEVSSWYVVLQIVGLKLIVLQGEVSIWVSGDDRCSSQRRPC